MKQILLLIMISAPTLLFSQSRKNTDRLKRSNKISQQIAAYDELDTCFVHYYDPSYLRNRVIVSCIVPEKAIIQRSLDFQPPVPKSNYEINLPAPSAILVVNGRLYGVPGVPESRIPDRPRPDNKPDTMRSIAWRLEHTLGGWQFGLPQQVRVNNIISKYKRDTCNTLSCHLNRIRRAILADTSKFNTGDLIHDGQTSNLKAYSPLFVINNRYLYRFDIIPPHLVMEFINEYLVPQKIDSIFVLADAAAASIWGSAAENGVVVANLKKEAAFNPRVAGLKRIRKKLGNNFQQGGVSRPILRQ